MSRIVAGVAQCQQRLERCQRELGYTDEVIGRLMNWISITLGIKCGGTSLG